MDLSHQQLDALRHGQAVPVTFGETEAVVVRKDVFEKIQHPPYDDSDWTDEEVSALASETLSSLDDAEKIQ